MLKARVCGGQNFLFHATFVAVTAVAFALSSDPARADEVAPLASPTTQVAPAATLQASGVVSMAPIPDSPPPQTNAPSRVATTSSPATSPTSAIISAPPTPASVVTMAPIADPVPRVAKPRRVRTSAAHVAVGERVEREKSDVAPLIAREVRAPKDLALATPSVEETTASPTDRLSVEAKQSKHNTIPLASEPSEKPIALNREQHCLATAIYFEARGESLKGQKAIAEVVIARSRTPGRPKTICGVVYEGSKRKTGCQFSFTCDEYSNVARPGLAWSRAKRIASTALKGRGKTVARGATFYHADYVSPGWATRMVRVIQIGLHIFYRPKRGRLL